jgi:ubiquinol-cytochrome c reductase cytochrome c1 subunit
MKWRHLAVVFLFFNVSAVAWAQIALLPVTVDVGDEASLQRGSRFFMNYCSGCHSLRYMRYNRMAHDIGLTRFTGDLDTDLLVSNLIFTEAKPQDPIENSMPLTDALQWFGRLPPDLSLIARERGASWLYTYLKSFYADKKRPFGTNNVLVPDVAMPNVLEPLLGRVIALQDGLVANSQQPPRLVLLKAGEMDAQEFDNALKDLVTFLVYVAEPAQLIRYRMGIFVMLFLCFFLVFAYFLKQNYWRRFEDR